MNIVSNGRRTAVDLVCIQAILKSYSVSSDMTRVNLWKGDSRCDGGTNCPLKEDEENFKF